MTDPTIEAVDAGARAVLVALWRARAESETAVGTVFTQLAAALAHTGAHPAVVALAERAASDEVRHAQLCVTLAEAYAGAPIAVAPPARVALPDYDQATPRARATLHAVNLCCIGETIATAFVEACLADCAGPLLREVHTQHLRDEIRHARVGWAHLASLAGPERAAIAGVLPELLRAQLAAWESRIGELPEHGVPGHGYPPRAALLETVHEAVRDMVLPGFDHVGVDTAAARAWFATHLAAAHGGESS